jgi:hypothetical protein
MAKRFIHVSFYFHAGNNKIDDLEVIFSGALDWTRYMPNCWILWTTKSPETWYRRVRHLINTGDNVFFVEINLAERQGWISKSVWDWINKPRD